VTQYRFVRNILSLLCTIAPFGTGLIVYRNCAVVKTWKQSGKKPSKGWPTVGRFLDLVPDLVVIRVHVARE
jgi:hypothetical protein